MFLSIGSIILDDIVLPSGITWMGMLGGGSPHAAMGMRLWTDHVGLLCGVGSDFPPDNLSDLQAVFDTRGIRVRQKRTPRAWQLFETDGSRTEVFRTPVEDLVQMEVSPGEYPFGDEQILGVHLQSPAFMVIDWARFLRAKGCRFILWEPWDTDCTSQNRQTFYSIVREVDAVSVSIREAQQVTSCLSPTEIVEDLFIGGATMVALRMGGKGSLVAQAGKPIKAVDTVVVPKIVDFTGAGNAYGGGFVVGYCQSADAGVAGRYGAVSASFALEQFGALYTLSDLVAERTRRYLSCEVRDIDEK